MIKQVKVTIHTNNKYCHEKCKFLEKIQRSYAFVYRCRLWQSLLKKDIDYYYQPERCELCLEREI